MSSAKKITLKSSDGEAFEVDEAVALESQTIKHMIEDDCADSGIPLPNVTSKILAKVIEYCKKHVEAANSEEKPSEDDLKAWDADFVKVDRDTIFDLIQAAHYLKIQSLLVLTCDTVLYMIKGKTPEEVYMFLCRDETRIHAKFSRGDTKIEVKGLMVIWECRRDPWLQNQLTQVELHSLKSQVHHGSFGLQGWNFLNIQCFFP